MTSKNLTQAHVQAADILTELYINLKEDQVLLFQMSDAIWRKVSACHLPQSCVLLFAHICRLQTALLQAAHLRTAPPCNVPLSKPPSVSYSVTHLRGISW